MPIHEGEDSIGKYFQYGEEHKYYYGRGRMSKEKAREAARKQGVAIKISQGEIKVKSKKK